MHNHLLGGGFGRRLDADGTVARRQDRAAGEWTREGRLEPRGRHPARHVPALLLRPAVGRRSTPDGRPVAWTHRIAGSSVMARYVPPLFKNGLDPDAVEGAAEPPYALPNIHVDYVRVEPPGIPTAFWRGVGPDPQRLRRRKLHRRTGGGGEAGSRRLSQGAARPQSARARRTDPGGGEGRLGPAPAGAARPWRLGPVRLRQLPRRRWPRSRSRPTARQGPSHRLRRRLRHRRSIRTRSRPRCEGGTIFGLTAALLRRDHVEERARRAGQFRQLSADADRRGRR